MRTDALPHEAIAGEGAATAAAVAAKPLQGAATAAAVAAKPLQGAATAAAVAATAATVAATAASAAPAATAATAATVAATVAGRVGLCACVWGLGLGLRLWFAPVGEGWDRGESWCWG